MLNYLKDIRSAIKNKNYYSALAFTLTLPDICIHTQQLNGRKNYVKWVNQNIFSNRKSFVFAKFKKDKIIAVGTSFKEYLFEKKSLSLDECLIKSNSINGDIMYALRCSYLHNGNANINIGRHPIDIRIDLGIIGSESESCSYISCGVNSKKEAYVRIDIVRFCIEVCDKIETYYNKNKKDFKNLLLISHLDVY